MTVYARGHIMADNRRVVSELLAEHPNFVFDLDLYLEALAPYKKEDNKCFVEYIEFLRQLRKTFTGCSFAMSLSKTEFMAEIYAGDNTFSGYNEMARREVAAFRTGIRSHKIFIYVPTNRYTSGWVGFGDFRLHDYDDYIPKIGVWSANISNYNIDNTHMQHSLKTTTTAARALRVATAQFKEEDMSLVALTGVHDARAAIQTDRRAVEDVVATARHSFIDHNAFPAAIEWLVDSGYEFNDKGLEDEMRTYVTELKYQAEVLTPSIHPNIIYVRGYLRDGEQVFDQVRITETGFDFEVDQILGTCNEADLSESTKRKLSILMMGDDDSFVSRVGYKLDAEIFYVFE